MSFNITFDKNKNIEIFLYRGIKYKDNMFYLEPKFKMNIQLMGTFLLEFLNINFEDNNEYQRFICEYCFEEFYYKKYPSRKIKGIEFKGLRISEEEFYKEIISIIKKERNNFINIQKIILKNLKCDKKEINNTEINLLIEDLNLDFNLNNFILNGISINSYNIPYGFNSSNITSILALEFKEFISNNKNIIKRCKNCGKYFISNNLKETKYCNNIFKNNKTCKQIGKEITYKNSLKNDKLLDMYRKRYLSLASAVSHYGTDTAIDRFERYKREGAIIRKKYINNEIEKKEFEEWIKNSKII